MEKRVCTGELSERLKVLELIEAAGGYEWREAGSIWAKAELSEKPNIFSRVGIGARAVKFTIRARPLTLHSAFQWNGRFCFLSAIIPSGDKMFFEVSAALIEPAVCSAKRSGPPSLGHLNRPVYGEPQDFYFPACVTEKYIGHAQEKPEAKTEARYVLVTPKAIMLSVGEIVAVWGAPFAVELCHLLDPYKNEYEIVKRGDA